MIILDTHALIWLDEGNSRLGSSCLEVLNSNDAKKELAASAISFWEIAMLLSKQRLFMDIDPDAWRKELLLNGLKELPVTGEIGITAGKLDDFHGDPADRIIAATALIHSATLCTSDTKLLAWPKIRTIDAEK